jgi:hypothetical protein
MRGGRLGTRLSLGGLLGWSLLGGLGLLSGLGLVGMSAIITFWGEV